MLMKPANAITPIINLATTNISLLIYSTFASLQLAQFE